MQNLEQIRARNAWQAAYTKSKGYAGKANGEVVKKIPPMIMNHGLLATAAFAFDDKNTGWREVFDEIAAHLSDPKIGILPSQCNDLTNMAEYLTRPEATSDELKLATNEAMAWLNYARRFITRKQGSNGKED